MSEKKIINELKKVLKIKEVNLEKPLKEYGDYAFPCFSLAKEFKKNPKEIAEDLVKKLKFSKNSGITKVESVGPYVNFFVDDTEIILKQIWKDKNKYGFKKKSKKIAIVEFPSPNTNKPLHLGHLRNMSLGECVSNLLESQGYVVKKVNLNNDRGIHICKSMLAYKKWGNGKKPNKKPDHFVGDFYVMYSKNEDDKLKQEAEEMLRKWESNDKKVINLWKLMNDWAFKGFNETYKRFNLKFDKEYYESKTYAKGKEIVKEGVKKKLFSKNEDGSIAVNLGKELGEKVLLRADGTSVYITQDLYLANLKYKDFKYNKSIYVVGNEQNYHFRVLFKILEMLKFRAIEGMYHLSYGMVNLPEGKMKSREGTVVDADNLLDELHEMAKTEIVKRNKIGKAKVDILSEKIGQAALRYYLLKYTAHKDFVFNPKDSISFEGETGPYIQYSLVRANKILAKVKIKPSVNIDFSWLTHDAEVELVKHMKDFGEVIEKSTEVYSPHILTEYTYRLASLFNIFYEKCYVINEENDKLKKARLLLVKNFTYVIENCLNLLGIEKVEMM